MSVRNFKLDQQFFVAGSTLVVLMGYIPGCPPEPPTLGCTGGLEFQVCSWKTGKGLQTCGGRLQCPGRLGPGSSLREGQGCSSHPS